MGRSTQISLFDAKNTVWEIKKHSSIVQMGNVTTLQERKAMNSLIWIAKDFLKRNQEQRSFQCDIGIVKRLSGLNDSNNDDLKDALRNLSSTKIEYNILNKDKEEWGIFSFLAEVKIKSEGRGKPTTITYEFPSTVWNVVKNPNMYVKLDLLIVRWLNSKHSVALYEVMKDYQNLWKYRCEIEEFRRLMGIQENQYGIFSMMRRRVLDRAVEEINEKTDIIVSYDLERMGRKVTAILLKVKVKNENQSSNDAPQAIEQKLKGFWINSKTIETLLNKHEELYLQANIAIVEEQMKSGKISNPAGYLLKAFQNDYRASETEYSKQQKEKEEINKVEQEEKERILKAQKEKRMQFEKWKSFMIETRLNELDSNEVEILMLEYQEKIMSNTIFSKMFEAKGFESLGIQIHWYKFLEPKLLSEKEQNLEWFA